MVVFRKNRSKNVLDTLKYMDGCQKEKELGSLITCLNKNPRGKTLGMQNLAHIGKNFLFLFLKQRGLLLLK